jgi:hypothetical protein
MNVVSPIGEVVRALKSQLGTTRPSSHEVGETELASVPGSLSSSVGLYVSWAMFVLYNWKRRRVTEILASAKGRGYASASAG